MALCSVAIANWLDSTLEESLHSAYMDCAGLPDMAINDVVK